MTSISEDLMKFNCAYYYVSPQDAEKIEAFKKVSFDTETTLITQYIRGWIGRNRDYYLQLARLDATAREISFRQLGEIVYSSGVEALPPYKKDIENVPSSPLREVVLAPNVIKRKVSPIGLGVQNLVLLKIGIYYDREDKVGFVSRIVKEHLDRNWDKLYASQVAAENFENWV
jgi:hypothetical protein